MEEKTLAKSYVYEGNVVNLREDKAQIDDGQIVDRVVVEHPGGVGIALEHEDGKFFFVKQYRYAQSEVTLEYPAGKREAGEDDLNTAKREIVEEVGEENAFIFGLSADEVMNYEKNGGYNPRDIYNSNMEIRKVLTQLVNGYYSPENPELFREIYDSLLNQDQYFTLLDFDAYTKAQNKINEAYKDEAAWAKSAILNIAKSGKFTADRTIEQYAQEIWHLEKVVL